MCAEGRSASSIARASDPLEGLQPAVEDGNPITEEIDDGITLSQAPPDTGHVAARGSSAEEAFWALLERASYTVW